MHEEVAADTPLQGAVSRVKLPRATPPSRHTQNMKPSRHDITLYEGGATEWSYTVLDGAGNPIDWSAFTFHLKARRSLVTDSPVVLDLSPCVSAASNGVINIAVPWEYLPGTPFQSNEAQVTLCWDLIATSTITQRVVVNGLITYNRSSSCR